MGQTENIELVQRFYDEAINKQDGTACARLLTEDFVHNNEFRGREGQQAAVNELLAAFPDLENRIMMTVAEDDKVAAHSRWRGTHHGTFLGIEPTGIKVEFTSTAILLIHDGQIAQAWDEIDLMGLAVQLKA
ncbi:MAG TPA: ester cyclase [Solirubrobacterales bacterium]|nr:ester cyclase [Solirubrobacterales bacterium]